MGYNLRRTLVLIGIFGMLVVACQRPATTDLPGPAKPDGAVIETSAEAAGLRWQECQAGPDGENWQQAEACIGQASPVWDDTDRANAGERTEHGYRLRIDQDVYDTYERATPLPNLNLYIFTRNGHPQRLFLGHFTTYSPIREATTTGLQSAQPVQPVPGAVGASTSVGKLAFVRDGSIWAMDLPDGQPRQITRSGNDHQPRWSPSGRWLAYAYGSLLWVVRDDGSQAHAIDNCPYTQGGR